MPLSHSGRARILGAIGFLISLGMLRDAAIGAAADSPLPSPQKNTSLTSIPLPVGQEAKGLVLPDFDLRGKLRARLEAGNAKRVDENHMLFSGLKMTTFTDKNAPDLLLEVPVSTLDLTTRVLTSEARTSVSRADFKIAGDAMRFDTVNRKGTLVGNVKMVITNRPAPAAKKPE
jgi:hypothetical protein